MKPFYIAYFKIRIAFTRLQTLFYKGRINALIDENERLKKKIKQQKGK
jgi:hypothetical protein